MEKISKMVYMAPFIEIVPMNGECVLHSPVSGWTPGKGQEGGGSIETGNGTGDLSKEFGLDFNYDDDYDDFGWDE